MTALELYLLGRRLTRLGETALRASKTAQMLPSTLLILQDVYQHPETPIRDVTARTGLPQSYVSATVARLREEGHLETFRSPSDRRCTLVRVTPSLARRVEERGAMPIDASVTDALAPEDAEDRAAVLAGLEFLYNRLFVRAGKARGPRHGTASAAQKESHD